MIGSESQLQRAVTTFLQYLENQGLLVWIPVPNGFYIAGGTPAARGRRVNMLKKLGLLRPGVSDILLCLKGGRFAAIELKALNAPKVKTDSAQGEFLVNIGDIGGLFAVCRTLDEVRECVTRWLNPMLSTKPRDHISGDDGSSAGLASAIWERLLGEARKFSKLEPLTLPGALADYKAGMAKKSKRIRLPRHASIRRGY